jgi:prophage regulatory protein
MMSTSQASDKSGLQRILRLSAVLEATGWSRSTLYAKIKDAKFPAAIKLDSEGRAVGWPEEDVLAHQRTQIQARNAGFLSR